MNTSRQIIACFVIIALTVLAGNVNVAAASPRPEAGYPAPPFKLPTKSGQPEIAIADFKGHPTALFFYCGCEWCFKCSTAWGQLQHALPPGCRTVVVFASGYRDALEFAQQTGLDLSTTTLLTDPADHVPDDLYNAPTCPRVFVIDAKGIIRYTNNHRNDAPRVAPAMAIAEKALTAMVACAPAAAKPAPALSVQPATP